MIKIAGGLYIKTASESSADGPETRLKPFLRRSVKNKTKPREPESPTVPGTTYTIPAAG